MLVWKSIWEQRKKYVNDINQSSTKLSHHTFIFTSKNKKKSFFSFISHLPFYIYVQKSIYIQNSLEKLLSNSFTSLLAPICSQFSSSSLCWIPPTTKKKEGDREDLMNIANLCTDNFKFIHSTCFDNISFS